MKDKLTPEMNEEFAKSVKVGLVASIDEKNSPHITVLSTLMGKGENTMVFGKFIEGLSKEFIQERPRAGFLIMNPEKEFWYGKMIYESEKKEGEEYVFYNNQPLYRYNTYFGINTVYYSKLVCISDMDTLPMGKIIASSLFVMLNKIRYKGSTKTEVMKPWAKKFTAKLDTLMFLSYIDDEGYPVIVPIIQAQSASTDRIVWKNKPFGERQLSLKQGQKIAILGFSMSMETVLLKGEFSGFDKRGFGYLAIDRVYNSMPPVHKYVYEENEAC